MTGYTVHTGSTEKFSSGWDRIFSGTKSARKTTSASNAKSGKKADNKASKRRKKS